MFNLENLLENIQKELNEWEEFITDASWKEVIYLFYRNNINEQDNENIIVKCRYY